MEKLITRYNQYSQMRYEMERHTLNVTLVRLTKHGE